MSVIKMSYLIEPIDQICLKIGKNISKKLSGKYTAEIVTYAFKTASKRANQIADKMTRTTLQKSSSELLAPMKTEDKKQKEIQIPPWERQLIIYKIRLLTYTIRMKYQKKINLLDNENTQLPGFRK